MSNAYSASKSAVKRVPLREHELLGLPKSTGKKTTLNEVTIQLPRMQPVRMKDFFQSTEHKKSTKDIPGRRMTTALNAISSVQRSVNKTILDTQDNAEGRNRHEPVRLGGLSKSDGKFNKTSGSGRERMEPERIKNLLESWEKNQTVKHPVRKSTMVQPRGQSVRRKLYNIGPSSPTTNSKTDRKSVAQSKIISQKTCIVNAKTVKVDNRKSVKPVIPKPTRKSSLLPPNSIRHKYVILHQSETIKEEFPLAITNEDESRQVDCMKVHNDDIIDSDDTKTSHETKKLSSDDEVFLDSENSDEPPRIFVTPPNNKIVKLKSSLSHQNVSNTIATKECVGNYELKVNSGIPRPSVIMGISAKEKRKEHQNGSNDCEEPSLANSRQLSQELNPKSVLLPPRFGANSTSLEDVIGDTSQHNRGESFYYDNLPRDSFLESTETTKNSFVNMDRQTISWIHGNLKQTVQSTEEQLFSMKLLLKTLEDVMKNDDNLRTQESQPNIEVHDVVPAPTELFNNSEKNYESESKNCQENDIDAQVLEILADVSSVAEEPIIDHFGNNHDSSNYENDHDRSSIVSDRDGSIFENFDEQDKENVCTNNDDTSKNSGVKSRRRSSRLMEKVSRTPKLSTDSFSQIEQELNIVHVKTKKDSPRNVKSVKRFDPRSRRSIREYMALKSTINFLATPDIKGFPTPKGEKDTPSHSRFIRRSLSRKLLTELDDLYAESPI